MVASLVFVSLVVAVISSLGAQLLPGIASTDHVSLSEAQWSLTATMLVGAVGAPVIGRLGDGPWRRNLMLACLWLVTGGCVLAALSEGSFAVLVAGRALQGFGLGLLPLTMAVVRDALGIERGRRAIALLSVTSAAGVGLGYPITGLLDDSLGIHSAFWFGAIFAGLAAVLAAAYVPKVETATRRRLDVGGGVLMGIALTSFLIAMTKGGTWGWSAPRTFGALVIAVLAATGWVLRERAVDTPLVEVTLLRHRQVASACTAALLIGVSMYMFLPIVTDLAQSPRSRGYGFGASVLTTGLTLVPLSLTSVPMSRMARMIGDRIGDQAVVPLGALVVAAANLDFALFGHALWQAFLAMGLAGIGIGFTFAAMPGLIIRSVPGHETGSALGFYQVVRYVGFSIGSALGATFLAAYTPRGQSFPERGGFTLGLIVSAGVCGVATLAGLADWLWRSDRRALQSFEREESLQIGEEHPIDLGSPA